MIYIYLMLLAALHAVKILIERVYDQAAWRQDVVLLIEILVVMVYGGAFAAELLNI